MRRLLAGQVLALLCLPACVVRAEERKAHEGPVQVSISARRTTLWLGEPLVLRINSVNAGGEPVTGYLEPTFDMFNLEVWTSADEGFHWDQFWCQRAARWADVSLRRMTLRPGESVWSEEIIGYTFRHDTVEAGWLLPHPGARLFPAPGLYLVRVLVRQDYRMADRPSYESVHYWGWTASNILPVEVRVEPSNPEARAWNAFPIEALSLAQGDIVPLETYGRLWDFLEQYPSDEAAQWARFVAGRAHLDGRYSLVLEKDEQGKIRHAIAALHREEGERLLREVLANGPFILDDYVHWYLRADLVPPRPPGTGTGDEDERAFIERFPDSPFVFEARRAIQVLEAMREQNRRLVEQGIIKPPAAEQAAGEGSPQPAPSQSAAEEPPTDSGCACN